MNKKDLKKLSELLLFNLDEKVIEILEQEYKTLDRKILEMHSIDVNGVEPMRRIDESEHTFLREDVEGDVLETSKLLSNSEETFGNYISISKVVKND